MNRILHVVYDLNAGGIETFVMNIYRNIDRKIVQFDFLVFGLYHHFYEDEVKKMGGIVYKMELTNNGYFSKRQSIRETLRKLKGKYKLVHIHSGQIDCLPDVIEAKKTGYTVVVHAHNGGLTKSVKFYHLRVLFQRLLRVFFVNYSDYCFSCSDLATSWSFPKNKWNSVTIINNGIDTERFRYNSAIRGELRQSLGISDNAIVIGHVGRFSYQKNHEYLIKVFDALHSIKRDSYLVLIGDGELKNSIEDLSDSLGLRGRVLFVGVKDNVNEWFSVFDAFVLPSHYEGLPVVGVEAQSSGVPCFFSNNITKQVNITNLCHYLDISKAPAVWANEILNSMTITGDRSRYPSIVSKSGFDIKSVANSISDFYLGVVNEK